MECGRSGSRGCLHHSAKLGPENAVAICIAENDVKYGSSVRSGIFKMSEAAWRISSMGRGIRVRNPCNRAYKSYEVLGGRKGQDTIEGATRVCPDREARRGQGRMGNMAQRCGRASYEAQSKYHGRVRRAGMAMQVRDSCRSRGRGRWTSNVSVGWRHQGEDGKLRGERSEALQVQWNFDWH